MDELAYRSPIDGRTVISEFKGSHTSFEDKAHSK